MKMDNVEGDILLARLKQLGASQLTNITSRLYYIIFKFNHTIEVSYVYNINAKNQYFLQRISPYPLPKGIFSTQEEIITFIEQDIKKFKNASQSSNFNLFLNINNTLTQVEQNLEHLFLNYNVSKQNIDTFYHQLNELNLAVSQAKNKSTHIMMKE